MANPEHLEVLRQGVEAWNEWRRQHPKVIRPDLSEAELTGAGLSRVHLSGADLSFAKLSDTLLYGADLSHADLTAAALMKSSLTDANLSHARLNSTNLSRADLFGADLANASLFDACLTGANMSRADLTNADLYLSILDSANLSGAILSRTIFNASTAGSTAFNDLDLRGAEGLEAVMHLGPSEIGIGTIYKSEGQISAVFLRGCGVPEPFIVQVPALVAAMQPIQFYSCFISYSSRDEELAQRLHADLQSKGVRCWFAPKDLKIGERFRQRIDKVIRVHDKLLLILSEHSVTNSWVEKEVETAMESEDEQKKTILFPVRLDDSVMEIKEGWPADIRRTRHIGDFRQWREHDEYQKAFDRLLRDLKAEGQSLGGR
jgi:uncharacterized protein YjbI with pentapeptide repeats